MKICPVAIAVGCPKCAMFKVCPMKSLIGGYQGEAPGASAAPTQGAPKK
ncbi:MAG TPA: hypothetical protein VF943_12635 [Burkholderiales bacterium]